MLFFGFFFPLPLPLLQSSSCNSLTFFAVSESVTKSGGCKDQPETCCVSVIDEHAVPSDVFSQNVLHFRCLLPELPLFCPCKWGGFCSNMWKLPTEQCDNSRGKRDCRDGSKTRNANFQTYQLTWWWWWWWWWCSTDTVAITTEKVTFFLIEQKLITITVCSLTG